MGEGVTDMGVDTRLGCLGLQYKYEKLLIGILTNSVPEDKFILYTYRMDRRVL